MVCSREHNVPNHSTMTSTTPLPHATSASAFTVGGRRVVLVALALSVLGCQGSTPEVPRVEPPATLAAKPPSTPPTVVPAPTPAEAPKDAPVSRICDPDGRCWTSHDSQPHGLLCVADRKRETAFTTRVDVARKLPPLKLTVGSRPFVMIDAVPCLSSSCSRNATYTCSLESHDSEHRIATSYHYEQTEDGHCTEDCRRTTAVCQLPPLKEGSHTLRFGDQSLTFQVPGELVMPCLAAAKLGAGDSAPN